MAQFTSKDGKVRCWYEVDEMRGCCGACIISCLSIKDFPMSCTAAVRDGYAKELYQNINYRVHAAGYCLFTITSLTTYGIKDFEVAYFDTDAHHDRKFNRRHVSLQGKMKESGRAKNPNTGNTIVMYTSPTKKSSYRPVDLPLATPYQNPGMPSWLTL